MPFQKVEYSFPDEEKEDSIVIEDSGEVEIDLSGKKTADDYANTPVEPEVEVEESKLLMIPQRLIVTVSHLSPRLMSRMKSLKATLKKYVIESSTSAKDTTTNDVPKKPLSENEKS